MAELRQLLSEATAAFLKKHQALGRFSADALWECLSEDERAALAAGVESGTWRMGGRLLHSERDPKREADRAAQALAASNALVAVSCGAGWLLDVLPANIRSLLLIEPSAFVTAAFLLARRYENFAGTITLFADDLTRSEALEEVLPWLQGKNLKKTSIYCHAASLAANKPLYTRAFERVVALFEKRSVNQATIVKFQQLWNKNIFLNQRVIWASATLNDLLALPAPAAIVLAGAGPSLSASFSELRKHRERFVLFAADTALIPLNKAGIYPDVVLAADPQWLNHHFAESPDAARSRWLMDPVVCPAIPHRLQTLGAQTAFWNNVFAADGIFRSTDRGDVAHGGSVSTNAFDIAVRWLAARPGGAGRLILVGQDLSFSDKQAHCRGAVLEAAVFNRANRLFSMEQHNLRQMKAMPVLWQKGIRQPQVRTNGKLRIFHDWFEARAADTDKTRVRLINATHDGAYLRGYEHMPLGEALEGLPAESATCAWQGSAAETDMRARAEKLIAGLRDVYRITRENAGLSRLKNPEPQTIQQLNANDNKLKATGIAREIAGLNAQALILKITEQGEEADAAVFYSTLARAAREVRHWARRML
ncbi:MAG: motility associated factor glycosyltransferase family protein [Spirochaetota bacterium]